MRPKESEDRREGHAEMMKEKAGKRQEMGREGREEKGERKGKRG